MPLRVLFCSAFGDGGWFAYLLGHNGHKVTYLLADDKAAPALEGIAPPPVGKVESPDNYDLVLFDMTGMGDIADQARTLTPTIGDSSFADQLEHDRVFGLDFMSQCGIQVPKWEGFTDPDDALRFIRETKKRYVFKVSGQGASCASSYVSKSPEDLERYLELLFRKEKVKEFILQEFVHGTEVSTEIWLNEEGEFACNHTLEEKKFLAGNLGPNVGCAGSVVWSPVRPTNLYERGLGKSTDLLRASGYLGPVDLNAIVTEGEVYGLEWTPRFGYEATCNLTRLLPMEFGEFCYRVATGDNLNLPPARFRFASTLRVSIPPYPLEAKTNKPYQQGVPIDGLTEKDLPTFTLTDVKTVPDSGEFQSAGTSGIIGSPIGVGETIQGSFDDTKRRIDKLRIPDMQWRVDVPQTTQKRYDALERQGWLRSI
jgi:phosphoribosylamine---glycine ligase